METAGHWSCYDASDDSDTGSECGLPRVSDGPLSSAFGRGFLVLSVFLTHLLRSTFRLSSGACLCVLFCRLVYWYF
eukprot:g44376.t1